MNKIRSFLSLRRLWILRAVKVFCSVFLDFLSLYAFKILTSDGKMSLPALRF
jgi:hypothetical protein